jgi:signal transduction histidine kinase
MSLVLVLAGRGATRDGMAEVVIAAGHEAIEAGDVAEALALIRSSSPDLLLSDVAAPGLDAYSMMLRLRADRDIRQPAVLFYAPDYLADQAAELADACGAGPALVKPVQPAAMLSAVDAAIARGSRPLPDEPPGFHVRHLLGCNGRLLEKVQELERTVLARRCLLVDVVGAQEAERQRVASDIHDDPLQAMAAVAIRLDMLAGVLSDGAERQAVTKLISTVAAAITRLRRLTFDLSPRSLETEALGRALETYLGEVGPAAGLQWRLEDGGVPRLPTAIKTILIQAGQEAIRNVLEHARAGLLVVSLRARDGGVELRVTDDGQGFTVPDQTAYRPGHFGLAATRERAEHAGGQLELISAPGAGTTVTVWIPCPRASSSVAGAVIDERGAARPAGERAAPSVAARGAGTAAEPWR